MAEKPERTRLSSRSVEKSLMDAANSCDVSAFEAAVQSLGLEDLKTLANYDLNAVVGDVGNEYGPDVMMPMIRVVSEAISHKYAQMWADGWKGVEVKEDPDLDAVVEELAAKDPQAMGSEEKVAYARRLLKCITWRHMMEDDAGCKEMYDDVNPSCSFGPGGAFQLRGDLLKKAMLYSTQAVPVEDKLDAFVSYTWAGDMSATAQALLLLMADAMAPDQYQADMNPKIVDAKLWLDRFSSPQQGKAYEQAARFGFFFTEYIALSPKALVIFSPQYISRLWCQYEFATFLALHDISDMYVNMTAFFRSESDAEWQAFADAIRSASVETASCKYESDREILRSLIDANFNSVAAFDDFSRYSSIALIARSYFLNDDYDNMDEEEHAYQRLIGLAGELNFADLLEDLQVVLSELVEKDGKSKNLSSKHEKTVIFDQRMRPKLQERQAHVIRPDSHLTNLRAFAVQSSA
eukprot:TRINITY_DN39810_c0_g1_i1.p1 TRINITY_DN39810_c0_g1~~TRINITY_DN39810_c0_g1_i1.p1  ORF type:complete len:465 (-),score=92.75 TRINITY_DN39810_c0_g1_i1:150-1544(-)